MNKLKTRNNLLEKLSGTNCGYSIEILCVTYKAVERSVLNYGAQEESRLPLRTRYLLAQLCCGYNAHLNSYLSRIDEDNNNCFYSPCDVPFLLNCPAMPITLKIDDLWNQPVEVADWLQL